jgi:hypothetical protein
VAAHQTSTGPYNIHSQPKGPHWIAWIARGDNAKPDRSIVLVARTREDAEARARQWAEQSKY